MTSLFARLRKTYVFLGPQVSKLIFIGVGIGLALFAVELAFAYGLQAFLLALGVASEAAVQLPSWVPRNRFDQVLIFIFVVGFFRGLLQWAQVYTQSAASECFRTAQRARVLQWAFHSKSVSSNRVTDLFHDRANSASHLVNNVQAMAVQITSAIFLGFSLLILAPIPTLAASFILFTAMFPIRALNGRIDRAGKGLTEETQKTNEGLLMNIKNLLLLQIYGTQNDEERRVRGSLDAFLNHYLSYAKIAGLKFAVPQMVGIGLICLIALIAKNTESMAVGILVSYFYLFVRFVQNMALVMNNANIYRMYWPQLAELATWWKHEYLPLSERTNNKSALQSRSAVLASPIGWQLRSIGFSYPGTNQRVLDDFNLSVQPGQMVVIMGPSGVGKSTILNLMLGMLDTGKGNIDVSFDGKTYPLSQKGGELLPNIGYVGPDSFIIGGSVRKNLYYGLLSKVSDDDIKDAIQQAECQFIYDFPTGLDHELTEQGQGLSAGQKQRISLARALLRKPKALILDEATSNLDSETEKKLLETFQRLKGKVTIVAVTHREAFLRIADQRIELT